MTLVPTGRSSSQKSSPKWMRRGAESVSMITVPGSSLLRRTGIFCSAQADNRPVVAQGGALEPQVGVGGRGMSDDREHRKVAHAVGIGVAVAQRQTLALGVCANPGGLGGARHDRGFQPAGRPAVHELEPVGDVFGYSQVAEERLNRDVEGARDDDLPEPYRPRLVEKLEGAGVDGRPDDLLEQILGEKAQPVLRLALVPLEEDVVE